MIRSIVAEEQTICASEPLAVTPVGHVRLLAGPEVPWFLRSENFGGLLEVAVTVVGATSKGADSLVVVPDCFSLRLVVVHCCSDRTEEEE
jgi:hypothetical protein